MTKQPITIVDKHIGNKLRYYRMFNGLTQVKLAERLGISAQQLQKYESGRNRISACTLYTISLILRVPVVDFFRELQQVPPLDKATQHRCHALLKHFCQLSGAQQQTLVTHLQAMFEEN